MFGVGEARFFACGLSLVLHPKNQWCRFMPTGVILKCTMTGDSTMVWWRTRLPYYLFEEDAIHFHKRVKPLATNTIRFIQNIKAM
jgi:coproporphyrinogen III oxidase